MRGNRGSSLWANRSTEDRPAARCVCGTVFRFLSAGIPVSTNCPSAGTRAAIAEHDRGRGKTRETVVQGPQMPLKGHR